MQPSPVRNAVPTGPVRTSQDASGQTRRRPVRRVAAVLPIALQLYAAGAYLVTTVGQYLLSRGHDAEPWLAYALSADGAANPLALVVVIPGYYIALLSGPVFALLALWGAAVAAGRWEQLSARSRLWTMAGVASCVTLFIFALTPLGQDLAVWVAG